MTLSVDWMAVATAAAAVAGPLIAIWVTRMSDGRREVTSRRMEIFRTLMRTRRMPIHYDHVAALNLVEIEFSGCQTVIAAWREYLRNLSERLSEPNDFDARTAFSKRREALLTKLIHEIALTLKTKVDQLEILEGNYLPQGWNDDDIEQRVARKAMIEVLGGRRPILFEVYNPRASHGPYPPAPKSNERQSQAVTFKGLT